MSFVVRSVLSASLPPALLLFVLGCSDTPSAGNEEKFPTQQSAQTFPYSHNPQKLARTGPDACVNCHAQAVEDWKQSHHAKANRPVSVRRDAAAFTPTRQIKESGVTYEMVQVGDDFKLRVIPEEGPPDEYNLVGVIGETPIRHTWRTCPATVSKPSARATTSSMINGSTSLPGKTECPANGAIGKGKA